MQICRDLGTEGKKDPFVTVEIISDFKRRKNKKGGEYGVTVSVMLPPEKL